MKLTVFTVVFLGMFNVGCSEKEWKCPEIEDAILVTSEYIGEGPYAMGGGRSFPHAAGDPGSFRAYPDTATGTITLKYRREGKVIVEIWSLQKLR